ncbi:hypothetical protein IWW54_002990 [Coemansia sp. RSA 2705]|nr:hypothetical protein IWW54_002990 [Coemansia sp. RSA 2705]
MRFFSTIALCLSAAAAQQIGAANGDKVAAGASAIDNPNVNNGVQADSSLFASGGSGQGSLFNNVFNSHFVNDNLNTAVNDNLVNNPGFTTVAGNSGWTANGDQNALGSVQNVFKRGAYQAAVPAYHAPAVYHPYAAIAPIVVPAPVHYYAPVFHTQPPPPYKAPAAEKPAHYAAPAAPEYHAPAAEYHAAAPAAPEYHAPAAAEYHAAAPAVAKQAATIIQNQA